MVRGQNGEFPISCNLQPKAQNPHVSRLPYHVNCIQPWSVVSRPWSELLPSAIPSTFTPMTTSYLIDIEGTLITDGKALSGSVEFIGKLAENKTPFLLITNTTTQPPEQIFSGLLKLGFQISENQILSPVSVAVSYLKAKKYKSCKLVISETLQSDFFEWSIKSEHKDAVVIGDIGNAWTYDLMNDCFGYLKSGAELIALHKGRFWQQNGNLQLDIGAFVAGLEYASGKTATVMGKPSKTFFEIAVAKLDSKPENTIMIGDDLISDIGGAQSAGLKTILVKTGKFREDHLKNSVVRPDSVAESLSDIDTASPSLL